MIDASIQQTDASGQLGDILGAALRAKENASDHRPRPGLPPSAQMAARSGLNPAMPAAATAGALAVEFLKSFDLRGRHNLVAITPDVAGTEGHSFAPGAWAEIEQWVNARDGRKNLYFSVNEPKWPAPNKRLSADDISHLRAVHCDIDPQKGEDLDAERRRLRQLVVQLAGDGEAAPSHAIDSGGGVQLIWKLFEKLPAASAKAAIEAQNRGISERLGGDKGTHDVARLLRLPGTMNLPDAGKRAKGRVPRRAGRIGLPNPDVSLEALAERYPPIAATAAARADNDAEITAVIKELELDWSEITEAEDAGLPADLQSRFDAACTRNERLRRLSDGDETALSDDKSGSGWCFSLAVQLARVGGFTPKDFGTLLWASRHSIAEGTERDDKLSPRAIARCWVNGYLPNSVERYFEELPDVGGEASSAAPKLGADATAENAFTAIEPEDIFGHEDQAELGDLPENCIPGWLAGWVRSEARRKGVPEAFPVAAAITVLAASVGNSLRIQHRQHEAGWTEPAALWTCLVGDPGSTKSAVMGAASAPLEKLNEDLIRSWRPKSEAWKKADVQAKRRRKSSDSGLDIDHGPEPRCGRRTVVDFTPEKLVRILADNPRGLLCAADELSALLGQFGAYKRNGDGDRAKFLSLFDGKSITIDRVGSEMVAAENALVSILVSSQPTKIRELTAGLSTDGMLQRCLFVVHDGRRRRGIDEELDAAADQAYRRVARGLAEAEYVFPAPIRLEPQGVLVLSDAVERIDRLRYGVGASDALKGHLSKWGKLLPRLVLTLHAANEFERHGCVDPGRPIPLSTVEMAINLARFFVRHSLVFYRTYGGMAGETTDARWIGEHLLTRPELTRITRRDIGDAKKEFRGDGVRKLLAAARELEQVGWLDVIKFRPDGPTHWQVNSRIHERFADHAKRATRERAERRGLIIESGRERGWINGTAQAGDVADLSLFD